MDLNDLMCVYIACNIWSIDDTGYNEAANSFLDDATVAIDPRANDICVTRFLLRYGRPMAAASMPKPLTYNPLRLLRFVNM